MLRDRADDNYARWCSTNEDLRGERAQEYHAYECDPLDVMSKILATSFVIFFLGSLEIKESQVVPAFGTSGSE